MKTKLGIVLATAIFSVLFFTVSRRKLPAGPSDFRDAPRDISALNDLHSFGTADSGPVFDAPLPAPSRAEASARPAEPKEWTVMVYSTTKDQLRSSLMSQLLDMKKTGSTGRVNVVAEASIPVRHADGSVSTDTIRMALGKAGSAAALDKLQDEMSDADGAIDEKVIAAFEGDIISRQKAADTGDWKKAAAFTNWAKTNYPAKRYVLYIYGHGTGFLDPKKKTDKGTLIDAETGNYVTLPEMRLLMAETGRVDVFVMTSCIMQMAEVAWQIKDYTDVIVGSSELMWSVGYDVEGMLRTLNSEPAVSSERLGAELADGYVAKVKAEKLPGGHSSVIVTSKLPAFAQKLNAWVDAEMVLQYKPALLNSMLNVTRFDIFGVTMSTTATSALARRVSMSADLYDFVRLVGENTPQDTPAQLIAAQKGRELMDFISKDLIYEYAYTGKSAAEFDFSRAHGLSIHVPPVRIPFGSVVEFEKHLETSYWNLPFACETKWGEFLGWIYGRK